MLKHEFSKRFLKDVERCRKRGYKMDKLKALIEMLINEQPLLAVHHDHALSGNKVGHRECHIAPDWLLMYYFTSDKGIVFGRTGTHSDLL